MFTLYCFQVVIDKQFLYIPPLLCKQFAKRFIIHTHTVYIYTESQTQNVQAHTLSSIYIRSISSILTKYFYMQVFQVHKHTHTLLCLNNAAKVQYHVI